MNEVLSQKQAASPDCILQIPPFAHMTEFVHVAVGEPPREKNVTSEVEQTNAAA